MKFVKGMVTGMVIFAGAAAIYAECCGMDTNKMMKKGKRMMKKFGI